MALSFGAARENVYRKTWENFSKGATPLFEDRELRLLGRVIKMKKTHAVIIRETMEAIAERPGVTISVYPHPQYFDEFQAAVAGVRTHGPAQRTPGAIGTLEMMFLTERFSERAREVIEKLNEAGHRASENLAEIRLVQGHYQKGKGADFLNSVTANKNKDWRTHAVKESIAVASERKTDLVVDFEEMRRNGMEDDITLKIIIADLCEKMGVTCFEGTDHMLIKTSEYQQK